MSTRQITVHVLDSSYSFFMELAKSLSFIEKIEETGVEKAPAKQEVMSSITVGIRQAEMHQNGELQLQTAQQLLDEL